MENEKQVIAIGLIYLLLLYLHYDFCEQKSKHGQGNIKQKNFAIDILTAGTCDIDIPIAGIAVPMLQFLGSEKRK